MLHTIYVLLLYDILTLLYGHAFHCSCHIYKYFSFHHMVKIWNTLKFICTNVTVKTIVIFLCSCLNSFTFLIIILAFFSGVKIAMVDCNFLISFVILYLYAFEMRTIKLIAMQITTVEHSKFHYFEMTSVGGHSTANNSVVEAKTQWSLPGRSQLLHRVPGSRGRWRSWLPWPRQRGPGPVAAFLPPRHRGSHSSLRAIRRQEEAY